MTLDRHRKTLSKTHPFLCLNIIEKSRFSGYESITNNQVTNYDKILIGQSIIDRGFEDLAWSLSWMGGVDRGSNTGRQIISYKSLMRAVPFILSTHTISQFWVTGWHSIHNFLLFLYDACVNGWDMTASFFLFGNNSGNSIAQSFKQKGT